MVFPFEFCALRYLLQWQRSERELHKKIKGKVTADQLRTALRSYQVARNFKGLKTPERAASVRQCLLSVRARKGLSPEEKVVALARAFKDAGFQLNLSAASKLLWLSSRRFIIYDSRAVTALKEHHNYEGKKDYSKFCQAWRAAYEQHQMQILKAVNKLPRVRAFMPAWRMSDKALLHMVRKRWFMERVFDIYLWELGGDG